MSEEAKQKQAEDLLGKALSAFGECEPPPDLEEGILRRVRAMQSRRSFMWLPVLAAAAALLIGVVLVQDWRTVEAPETAVAELPAPPPPPAPPSLEPTSQADNRVPAPPPQRRSTARKAPALEPAVPAEESQIAPFPQSELSKLAFSDIASSPIQIQVLERETTPLVSGLSGPDTQGEPAAEGLISGLEEGR